MTQNFTIMTQNFTTSLYELVNILTNDNENNYLSDYINDNENNYLSDYINLKFIKNVKYNNFIVVTKYVNENDQLINE
jgi:hypothetical protein